MDQDLVSCPYNDSHRFARNKFIFHITRCKDKIKVAHMFTSCVFNHLHIVLKDDLLCHYTVCEDRISKLALASFIDDIKFEELTKSEQPKIEEPAQIQEEFHAIQECQAGQKGNLRDCTQCCKLLGEYLRSACKDEDLDRLISKLDSLVGDIVKLE